jgi:hypothetical protein
MKLFAVIKAVWYDLFVIIFLVMFVVFSFIDLFPCRSLHWPVEAAGCCSHCRYPIITPHVTTNST